MHFDRAEVAGVDGEAATGAALLGYMEAEEYVERVLGDEMGSRELIKLCICCWDYLMLHVFSGSVAVWMFLSDDLQHSVQGTLWPPFTHSNPFHPILAHLNASKNRSQLAPLDSAPIAGATYAREPRQHSVVFLSLVQPFFAGLPATSLVALSRRYLWVSLATLLIQHDSDS